jgi:hypothetical protein
MIEIPVIVFWALCFFAGVGLGAFAVFAVKR